MKNKLRLLSSLPALAVVATVPAALTSCKSNYVEPVYRTEITADYNDPEVQSLETADELFNQKDVTDLYLSQIKNNPMMFVKDMTCAAALKYTDFANVFLAETGYKDPDGATLQKCEFGFSKPTFGQTSVWEMGFEDEIYTTVSFKQEIYLEYLYKAPDNKTQIVKKISANIDYNNVLFMISESNWDDVANSPNWLIGVIDPWFQDDAFWVYQYNTNPWSINFGFSYEVTKTIFGSPDVNIYNCTYYSGNVDSAKKLYNLWDYSRRLDDVQPSDIPCESALERMMIKCILCMEYGSKILYNVVNQPDVCISGQLQGEYKSGQSSASLSGITFIYPKSAEFDPSQITINLGDYGHNITCQGITTTGSVTIANKQEFVKKETNDATSQEFLLPVTVNDVQGTVGEALSFDVPYRALKICIKYGSDVEWDTELFLHYNALVLNCVA